MLFSQNKESSWCGCIDIRRRYLCTNWK